MEYLPGGTLKQRIKQGLPLESTIQITRSIAKALGYAHEKGLVHRDVKPPNILFRDDDTPVLTDFGVARAFESKTINTMAGLTVGSPGYMSPEQARGETATIQSDLYSLGVVIYEMLTGHPLYEADNVIAITLKHLHDPIPKLPKEYICFQPVLNRLLAKKSSDRYANISEFLKAFDTLAPSGGTGSLPRVHTDISSVSIAEFTSGKLRALLHTDRKLPFSVLGIVVAIAIIATVFNLKIKNPESNTAISGQTQSATQTKQITALLKQAEAQLKAKVLSGASENSAESIYRRVLKLEPGNIQALRGLQNIATEYEQQAQKQFNEGSLQGSLDDIHKGLTVMPAHEGLMRLRRDVEHRIADVKAQKARQEDQEQRQLQAEQFFIQAQSSFQEGALEIALAHIEQGLLAIPDHRELLALRERVRARLVEQQRRAEAQRRQQEEAARRQAEITKRQEVEQARQEEEAAQRWREEALWQAEEAERRRVEKARQQAEAARWLQEAEQYLARALDDQRNGQYVEGLKKIEKGLALVPNHAELLRLREEVRAQLALEPQKQEQQRKEQQGLEEQRQEQQRSEQRQQDKQRQEQLRLEQQRQEQQRSEQRQQDKQRQEQLRREQQKLEQQRQEEKQGEQQRRFEQQRQEEKQRQEQQRKLDQQRLEQQRLEKQRKEQQRLEQQRQEEKQRQEQQRKLEPQRQEQPPSEQPQKAERWRG